MNELLEQFLVECRELAQQATRDLLALEASPRDAALIDGVFRGFHTLKGAAGIVEFPAMGRLLHEAETMLAGVRAGAREASAELIGDCLASLDQLEQWLDEIEASGDLPPSPDAAAAAVIARLARTMASAAEAAGSTPVERSVSSSPRPASSDTPDWVVALSRGHPEHSGRAQVALRYEPDSDCFFRGDDPLAAVAGLPGLRALDVAAKHPWPPVDALDPFECNLIITALVDSPRDLVAAALRPVLNQAEIWPLTGAPGPRAAELSTEALAVLEEQARLVSNSDAEGLAGRLGSAAQVARNVLTRAGIWADARVLDDALVTSLRTGDGAALANSLRALLAPAATPAMPGSDDATARQSSVRALRVDVERIDALVSLAGELTVAKNAIGHAVLLAEQGAGSAALTQTLKDRHARMDRLVSELQRSVLGIRVLPLAHVFQRFPRLIREMARDLGKSVRLVIEGETSEADKATVEALFEPMLHVLRNAMDHGVEPEAVRRGAGKPPTAEIRLRGERDGDRVIVEMSDDGAGIDVEKIRRAAERQNIASPDAVAAMSDAEAMELIFSPGFSTAATVTETSGRGVGMDAVRSAIARIGGQVTVTSQPEQGTSVRFTLPFSIIMARVMTVEAGGQIFGLPIECIAETAIVPRERISRVGAAEAFALRARTVPLIRLAAALDLSHGREGDAALTGERDAPARVVVVSAGGQTGAIEVDAFGERMDVMLRPMEGILAGIAGYAGTTLLGDGRVLIVLDPLELLR